MSEEAAVAFDDFVCREVRIIRKKVNETGTPTGLRVGVYIRASTLEQIHSEARQRKFAVELASRLGTLVEIFLDIGKTGRTTIGRDGLEAAKECAKQRLMDVLVIDGVSRLARDTADTLQIYKYFSFYKVQIYESSAGQALTFIEVAIKGITAQFDSEARRDLSAKGRKLAVEDGRSPHRPRYGFVLQGRRRGRRLKHEARARAVVKVFEDTLRGVGAAEIARSLTGHYPTPGDAWRFDCGHDQVEKRSTWTGAMIVSIIRCPLYKGKLIDGFSKTVRALDNYQVKTYEPQEPENFRRGEIKDSNLHLVSAEVWRRANEMVVERRTTGKPADHSARHLLTGRIACGACSGPLASAGGHGDRIYRCDACRVGKRAKVHVRVAWVERTLLEALRDGVLGDGDAAALVEAACTARRERNEARDALERKLQSDIRDREARIRRSFELSTDDPGETEVEARRKERGEQRFRGDLEREIEILEQDLEALPEREPDLDVRSPADLKPLEAGLAAMLAAVPIRPDADEDPESYPGGLRDPGLAEARASNALTLRLIATLRELVASVAVSPASDEGLIKVSMRIDLSDQASGAARSPALIELEAFIDRDAQLEIDRARAATARDSLRATLSVDPRHRIDQDAWSTIATRAADLEEALEGTGWEAKSLVEAFCLRARTKIRIRDLPAAFGPWKTYAAAAEALKVRWIDLGEALAATCPSMLEDAFANMLPAASAPLARPALPEGATRAATEKDLADAAELEALAEEQTDPEVRRKLSAVAMHMRGVKVAAIAKMYEMRGNRVSDLAWRFRRAGKSVLGVYVAGDAAPAASKGRAAELRDYARKARCPDIEIACIALARVDEGVSLVEARARTGVGLKQFDKWRAILKSGGPAALADSRWPSRFKDIPASPRFRAEAARLRAKADDATDPAAREKLLLVVMYLEGRANADVAAAGKLDSHALRHLLDRYREHGEEALQVAAPRATDPRPEEMEEASALEGLADAAADPRHAKRLRIVAACLRREGRDAIAARLAVSKPVVDKYIGAYRRSGRIGIVPPPAPAGPLTERQAAALRCIVARGTDPDDECEVITLPRLQRYCVDEFSLILHPGTLRKALAHHSISLKSVKLRRESRIDKRLRSELEIGGAEV